MTPAGKYQCPSNGCNVSLGAFTIDALHSYKGSGKWYLKKRTVPITVGRIATASPVREQNTSKSKWNAGVVYICFIRDMRNNPNQSSLLPV